MGDHPTCEGTSHQCASARRKTLVGANEPGREFRADQGPRGDPAAGEHGSLVRGHPIEQFEQNFGGLFIHDEACAQISMLRTWLREGRGGGYRSVEEASLRASTLLTQAALS